MALSATGLNNPLPHLEIPEYLEVRYLQDVPGTMGSVLEYRLKAWVRKHGDEGYTAHDWYATIGYTEEPSLRALQNTIDRAPLALHDVVGFWLEYDYDEAGNTIPGSERKVYFDRWKILVGDKVALQGYPIGGKVSKPVAEEPYNFVKHDPKLLHKWLGGQAKYFVEKVGYPTLMEILNTIERRRG